MKLNKEHVKQKLSYLKVWERFQELISDLPRQTSATKDILNDNNVDSDFKMILKCVIASIVEEINEKIKD